MESFLKDFSKLEKTCYLNCNQVAQLTDCYPQPFTKIVRQNTSSRFPPHQCCTRAAAG